MLAYHIIAKGTVQGVGFRYFTKLKALDLGLCGWVENKANGNVEIKVEGPKKTVTQFLKWCHNGPESAIVDKLEYTEISPQAIQDFKIRR